MTLIATFFIIFFIIRLIFLLVSIKNEKKLIDMGAKQIGEKNSKLLTIAHIVYYFSSLASAYILNSQFNWISILGVFITTLSFIVLWFVVSKLGKIWTVKVYILPNHTINRSWLFKTFRHPNYFLNIIPELIGIAILCQAWYVLMIGFPIYCCILFIRIKQEESAMAHLF